MYFVTYLYQSKLCSQHKMKLAVIPWSHWFSVLILLSSNVFWSDMQVSISVILSGRDVILIDLQIYLLMAPFSRTVINNIFFKYKITVFTWKHLTTLVNWRSTCMMKIGIWLRSRGSHSEGEGGAGEHRSVLRTRGTWRWCRWCLPQRLWWTSLGAPIYRAAGLKDVLTGTYIVCQ